MKNKNTYSLLIVSALLLAAAPVRADLPGLPAAKPAEDQPVEAKGAVHAAQPEAPLRGSLFKQGVAVAAAQNAAGEGSGREGHSTRISFIDVAAPQPRHYKKNDIVTVIVREDSDSTTNGKGNSKKTQDFDLALQQFLQLGFSSSGVPQVTNVANPSTLPEIKFKYNNDGQTDASQERQDSFSTRIAAMVVDVKPNGTMVVEASKHITVDKENQTFKLSGICRVEDIAVDNTVLSTQLAGLALSKQTTGIVHDANKRGWLNGLIDVFTPF